MTNPRALSIHERIQAEHNKHNDRYMGASHKQQIKTVAAMSEIDQIKVVLHTILDKVCSMDLYIRTEFKPARNTVVDGSVDIKERYREINAGLAQLEMVSLEGIVEGGQIIDSEKDPEVEC